MSCAVSASARVASIFTSRCLRTVSSRPDTNRGEFSKETFRHFPPKRSHTCFCQEPGGTVNMEHSGPSLVSWLDVVSPDSTPSSVLTSFCGGGSGFGDYNRQGLQESASLSKSTPSTRSRNSPIPATRTHTRYLHGTPHFLSLSLSMAPCVLKSKAWRLPAKPRAPLDLILWLAPHLPAVHLPKPPASVASSPLHLS